jgi:hypothetical protein
MKILRILLVIVLRKNRLGTIATTVTILALLGPAVANAGAGVVYQTGFESPTFSPSTINGQDGWFINGAPSQTVTETAVVKSGLQAVGITPAGATSGVVGAVRSTSYDAANQILTFGIDALLSGAGTPSFWTAIDTQYPNGSLYDNIDINIDQSGQNEIHVFIAGTDYPTGVFVTRGVWNHYELDVNFINNTVSAFYNGSPLVQNVPFTPPSTTLGVCAFYAQGEVTGTDTGYFDNFSITASSSTECSGSARVGTAPPGSWAGYIVGVPDATVSTTFQDYAVSDVRGTWIVPQRPSWDLGVASAIWVGIGGYVGDQCPQGHLVQIGTEDAPGNPGPIAFYRVIDANNECINPDRPLFAVNAGDTISAEVLYSEQDEYQLTIKAFSQGSLQTETTLTISSSGNLRQTAEWIVENPEGAHPLEDFGVVNFNDCSVILTNFEGSSITSSINGNCKAEDVALSMNEGGEAQPSDLSSDGTSFAVESCTFTLSATSVGLPAKGGSKNVSVKVKGTDCSWTAVSNDPFITITSGSNVTGNGKVVYSVPGNTNTAALTGTMTIAGQTFTVNQAAGGCTFKLSPKAGKIKATGGSATVKVKPNLSDCAWTAVSNDSFITIMDGGTGLGKGTVSYTVPANTNTTALTGSITIDGETFTVTQSGER